MNTLNARTAPPLIIWIDPKPRSLSWRWYLAAPAGTPLLRAVVNRLAVMWPGPIHCATTRYESTLVQDALSGASIEANTLSTESRYTRFAWRECMDLLGSAAAAFCQPEAVLCPNVIWTMLHEHDVQTTDVFRPIGSPRAVYPLLFGADALRRLAAVTTPGVPFDALDAIQVIEMAGAAEALGLRLLVPPLPPEASSNAAQATTDLHFDTPSHVEALADAMQSDAAPTLSRFLRAAVAARARERTARVDHTHHEDDSSELRVLFASVPSAFSGAEDSLCDLVQNLDHAGYRSALLVSREGTFTDRMSQAAAEIFCPERNLGLPTVANYAYAEGVIASFRPDVVHLNSYVGPAVLAAAMHSSATIIQHIRLSNSEQLTEQLECADQIVSVSEYAKAGVLRLGIPADRVTVVYDGVDTRRFRPDCISRSTARAELGIHPETLLLLMVARFAVNKRHDLLLQALHHLRADGQLIEVMFVGDPEGENSTYFPTRSLAADLGVLDHVHFLGFAADIRVPIAAADVLVLPSEREPLGQCVLQAAAMGVPVVVTMAGGLAELLSGCPWACVIAPDSVEGVSDAVRDLTRPERIANLRREAASHAEHHFRIEDHVSQIERVWRKAMMLRRFSLQNRAHAQLAAVRD